MDQGYSDPRFFNGLLWYLEMRNWAFEKVRTCPHGSESFDVRMWHDLYFSYLISAIDHVKDYLRHDQIAQRDFEQKIASGLGDADNYKYARELRNEIVHRGHNSAFAADSINGILHVICPETVTDIKRQKTYQRPFKYTVELARRCNAVLNAAIGELLEKLDFFNLQKHKMSAEETITFVQNSPDVPDFVKRMIPTAFSQMDFPAKNAEMAATGIRTMRNLLDMDNLE